MPTFEEQAWFEKQHWQAYYSLSSLVEALGTSTRSLWMVCFIFYNLGVFSIERLHILISPRDWPVEKLKEVKVADALKHPNWSMGRKITVDSATLMNKVHTHSLSLWNFELGSIQGHSWLNTSRLVLVWSDVSFLPSLCISDIGLVMQFLFLILFTLVLEPGPSLHEVSVCYMFLRAVFFMTGFGGDRGTLSLWCGLWWHRCCYSSSIHHSFHDWDTGTRPLLFQIHSTCTSLLLAAHALIRS